MLCSGGRTSNPEPLWWCWSKIASAGHEILKERIYVSGGQTSENAYSRCTRSFKRARALIFFFFFFFVLSIESNARPCETQGVTCTHGRPVSVRPPRILDPQLPQQSKVQTTADLVYCWSAEVRTFKKPRRKTLFFYIFILVHETITSS